MTDADNREPTPGAEAPLHSPLNDVSRRHWAAVAFTWLSHHLPLVLSILTATWVLSGLAYVKGYLGRLGLDALVFSLPFEMYVAAGAITAVTVILVSVVLSAPFGWFLASRGEGLTPRWVVHLRAFSVRHPMLVFTAVLFIAAFMFAWPWRWLAPVAGLLPVEVSPGVELLFLVLLLPLLIGASILTFASVKGTTAVVVSVWLLMGYAPGLAHQMGEYRAERLFAEPEGHSRALIWWTSQDAPVGYLIVHQDGGRLYLAVQTEHASGERQIYSTFADLAAVHRVMFVPAHVDIDEFREWAMASTPAQAAEDAQAS